MAYIILSAINLLFLVFLIYNFNKWKNIGFYLFWLIYWIVGFVGLALTFARGSVLPSLNYVAIYKLINVFSLIKYFILIIGCLSFLPMFQFKPKMLFYIKLIVASIFLYSTIASLINYEYYNSITDVLFTVSILIYLVLFDSLFNKAFIVKIVLLLYSFSFYLTFFNDRINLYINGLNGEQYGIMDIMIIPFMFNFFYSGSLYLNKTLTNNRLKNQNSPFDDQKKDHQDRGEYIKVNIPNNQRDKFVDILKAFEAFANLKGYKLYVSIDISMSDILAFKFTIDVSNPDITQFQVRSDLEDFISSIKRGDFFDGMPYILSPHEHELVWSVLRAKLITLKHELELKELSMSYMERILASTKDKSLSQTYIIKQSTVNIENKTLQKEIAERIDSFLCRLETETNASDLDKQKLNDSFISIKNELSKEKINNSKIIKLSAKAKHIAEKVVFGHHCEQAIKSIWNLMKDLLS